MKKKKFFLYGIWLAVSAATIGLLIYMNMHLEQQIGELNNQLTYLLDTNSIIQNDVGTMQSNIRNTLQEEASLLTDYSFTTEEVDFVAKTYRTKVIVVPKDYTNDTKIAVYFGTQEYALELDGNSFTADVTLPLTENYDGNVTVLVKNGDKKSTEVLKNYVGYPHSFEDVLYGNLNEFPEYKDGKLTFPDKVSYTLEGNDAFTFDSCDFVVKAGEEEIYQADMLSGTVIKKETSMEEEIEPETQTQITRKKESVNGASGNYAVEDEFEVPSATMITVLIRAVSKEGYTFEYSIFEGETAVSEKPDETKDGWEESEDYLPYEYSIFDEERNSFDISDIR